MSEYPAMYEHDLSLSVHSVSILGGRDTVMVSCRFSLSSQALVNGLKEVK